MLFVASCRTAGLCSDVLGGKYHLPLENTTFLNFLGSMGYMSGKDENFPRAQGVLRGKYRELTSWWFGG